MHQSEIKKNDYRNLCRHRLCRSRSQTFILMRATMPRHSRSWFERLSARSAFQSDFFCRAINGLGWMEICATRVDFLYDCFDSLRRAGNHKSLFVLFLNTAAVSKHTNPQYLTIAVRHIIIFKENIYFDSKHGSPLPLGLECIDRPPLRRRRCLLKSHVPPLPTAIS